MSIRSTSRRLVAGPAAVRSLAPIYSSSRPSPLLALLLPNAISRRSFLGFGRKKQSENEGVENPVYNEYLKRKPSAPPALVRGDLSSGSIFDAEEPDPKAPTSTRDPSLTPRDPAVMAAVLDPQPEVRRRWQRKMVIRSIRHRGRLSKAQQLKKTERELLAKSHFFKTSVKKLGPLARQIAGKPIDDALVQMRFSKKKAAKDVKEHLEHARNEAIVKRGMALGAVDGVSSPPVAIETKQGKKRLVRDRSELYIDQAWVGRGPYGKGLDHRARGRINTLRLPYTSISVILKEEATRIREHEEREEKRKTRKLWVPLPNRPITAQRQYYSW